MFKGIWSKLTLSALSLSLCLSLTFTIVLKCCFNEAPPRAAVPTRAEHSQGSEESEMLSRTGKQFFKSLMKSKSLRGQLKSQSQTWRDPPQRGQASHPPEGRCPPHPLRLQRHGRQGQELRRLQQPRQQSPLGCQVQEGWDPAEEELPGAAAQGHPGFHGLVRG